MNSMDDEEFRELMRLKVKESVDGKSVTIPLDFLYSIQMFLMASSHMEDEGKLPYPSFEFLSHDLAYKIREYTKDHVKFFPLDCYLRYDDLWDEYNKEHNQDDYDVDGE